MEAEMLAAETETARLMSARSMASSVGGNIQRANERQTVVNPMIMTSSAETQP